MCVVEVVESCGRHLDKLINVDEFLRRITTVMHSNDPVSIILLRVIVPLFFMFITSLKRNSHIPEMVTSIYVCAWQFFYHSS